MKSVLYTTAEGKLDAAMAAFKKEIETNRNTCLLLVPENGEDNEFVKAIKETTGADIKAE